MAHAESAGGLRHPFDEEHGGPAGIARGGSLKTGRVGGHVVDAGGGAVAVNVDDTVDHEERVAMWQKLQDVGDFRPPELRFHSALVHPDPLPVARGQKVDPWPGWLSPG